MISDYGQVLTNVGGRAGFKALAERMELARKKFRCHKIADGLSQDDLVVLCHERMTSAMRLMISTPAGKLARAIRSIILKGDPDRFTIDVDSIINENLADQNLTEKESGEAWVNELGRLVDLIGKGLLRSSKGRIALSCKWYRRWRPWIVQNDVFIIVPVGDVDQIFELLQDAGDIDAMSSSYVDIVSNYVSMCEDMSGMFGQFMISVDSVSNDGEARIIGQDLFLDYVSSLCDHEWLAVTLSERSAL